MNKTRFRDSAEDQGVRDRILAVRQRAQRAEQELRAIKARIGQFYISVDHVTFGEEKSAPKWTSDWLNWLLAGILPAVCKQDGPYAQSKADLQPVETPEQVGLNPLEPEVA